MTYKSSVKHKGSWILLCLMSCFISNAQEEHHPYKIHYKVDVPVTAVCIAGSILTYPLRDKKTSLDSTQIAALKISSLMPYNRNATKLYSHNAIKISDLMFYSGFALPGLLFCDKYIRKDGLTLPVLYLEALSIAGLLDGIVAGSVSKPRPYVYNPDVPLHKKNVSNALGSFYGSHPSFTAACSFFTAQVYSDYHPGSKAKPWIWAGAGALTLASSWYRYNGGQHFIEDMAAGVGIGAAIGILVPRLHRLKPEKVGETNKRNSENYWCVTPSIDCKGVGVIYRFN